MFFNVQGDCNQTASMTQEVKVKCEMVAETATFPFSCAYHVSKFGHAKTVGLDAFIGHDVVHQHQSAVVEPDFPAAGLL